MHTTQCSILRQDLNKNSKAKEQLFFHFFMYWKAKKNFRSYPKNFEILILKIYLMFFEKKNFAFQYIKKLDKSCSLDFFFFLKKSCLSVSNLFSKIFYVPELVGFQTVLIIDQKNISLNFYKFQFSGL